MVPTGRPCLSPCRPRKRVKTLTCVIAAFALSACSAAQLKAVLEAAAR